MLDDKLNRDMWITKHIGKFPHENHSSKSKIQMII